MKTSTRLLAAALLALGIPASINAQSIAVGSDIPRIISYQGQLQSSTLLSDGDHFFTARLYSDANGKQLVWKGSYSVAVHGGLFALQLGSGEQPLPDASSVNSNLFLSIEVDGKGELKPFTQMTAAAYALNVANGAITKEKMGTDYVSSIRVNGKKVTQRGGSLNINSGAGISLSFDESQNALVVTNDLNTGLISGDIRPMAVTTVANGGTGLSTITNHGVMIGQAANNIKATTLNNGELLIGSNNNDPVASTLSGTSNQVIVTNGSGSITLSTPQSIGTSSSPTFNNLTLSGDATTNGNELVKGNSTVNGNVLAKGNLTTNGDLSVLGNATTNGNDLVKGNSTVNGNLLAKGNLTTNGDLSVSGDATTNGNDLVKGNSTINGNVLAKGNLTTNNDLSVSGSTTTNGNELVKGNSTVNGNVLAKGNLTTNGDLSVSGDATTNGNELVKGNSTMNNDLLVKHDITVNHNMTVKGSLTVNNNFAVSGNITSSLTGNNDNDNVLTTKSYVDDQVGSSTTNGWRKGGNSNTNEATNYLGTKDLKNLTFRTNATERLKIMKDGAILFNGAEGAIPVSGSGTRMMWIPSLASFRAGTADGSEWDDGNIGDKSFAVGYGPLASGNYSFAAGFFTTAGATSATAFGSGTMAVAAGSTALGSGTTASGLNSIAMGDGSNAYGYASTATGSITNAYGLYSTATGFRTSTMDNYAFSAGRCLKVGLGSLGFNGSTTGTTIDMSSMNNIAYFGDVDVVIGNDDNVARGVKFMSANGTTNVAAVHSTRIIAGSQSSDITYTLPTTQGAAGSTLSNNGSGTLSWSTPVTAYGTVSAGATITIQGNTSVVKITDDADSTAVNAVTMPTGTNGQIIYIYNNDAQATTGDITLPTSSMGVYVYVDGWKKAN